MWETVKGAAPGPPRTLYWRPGGAMALRKGDWKLVHIGRALDQGTDELYNIAQDPLEERDLAAQQPAIVAGLRAEMAKQRAKETR